MDVGGTKMEPPRQFLQETPAPTSTNPPNLPLDNPSTPASLETNPSNPLSYWPPPPTSLPFSTTPNHPSNPRIPSPSPSNPSNPSTPSNPSNPFDDSNPEPRSSPHPRTLHHNLPPIASITSSHNYRGVREVHKHSHPTSVEEPKPEVHDVKSTPKPESEKQDDADCQIVEVPDRPKSEEYVFSVPTPVASQQKMLMSPRATTPASTPDTPTVNSTLSPARTPSSPSTRPSPQFIAPSPTIQSPSPSEPPRTLPSPSPSPSNLHRALSSHQNPPKTNFPHPEFTRPLTSHDTLPRVHPPSPQRIQQPPENQVCRNPFELPITKPYHQYHPEHHHHRPQERFVGREQHRLPGFYPPGFKPLPQKDSSDVKQVNSQGGKSVFAGNPVRGDVGGRSLGKQGEAVGSKANGPGGIAWSKPETQKNLGKVNGSEYSNRKMPEVGYQSPVKHPPEGFPARFNDKHNGSFNQINPLSQRFPPVPQSNYDLNRHIYDSMTAPQRPTQPQVIRPIDKNPFPSSNTTPTTTVKNHPFYRDLPEHDKIKTYIQPHQPRTSTASFTQFNPLDKPSQRPHTHQPPHNPSFPQPLSNPPSTSINQPFPSRINTAPHMSQPPCPATSSDTRPTQPFHKHHNLPPHDPNKLPEPSPQISSPHSHHSIIATAPPKARTPSTTLPVRSKRESPLDLSVKTVRQSADSTAKDDNELYLHNFRNYIQGPVHPQRTDTRYPVSQSTDSTNAAPTGAPKIDFTPNFSGFHTDAPPTTSHHNHQPSSLPPVESFKKLTPRLPTSVIQEPTSRSFNPPNYFPPHKSTSDTVPTSTPTSTSTPRYPDHFQLQKRPIDDPLRTHSSQAKIPKIDPWKLAFDQQIEQRLNSARLSHQNTHSPIRPVNGIDASKPPSKPTPKPSHYPSTYQTHPPNPANPYRTPNMYPQTPVQTSATPYNPSYIHQPHPHPATPQTPQHNLPHQQNLPHSPDPDQIIKQISKGVMPDHNLLHDKNVLSILRSSLEEKEAKLMHLREVAKRKEKYKDLIASDPPGKQPLPSNPHKTLPSFKALTLQRMCAPPSFPGHRLTPPRPLDTVNIDIHPTHNYFGPPVKNDPDKSGIPTPDLSPHDDAQGPPTDLDGLAAFLAARIRTKGELKQVGPEPGRVKCGTTVEGFGVQTNGSPPKLVRESRLLPPLRRRYFSHTEEETPTTSGVGVGTGGEEQPGLPPRDPNGIRSSSETSVFDFRESDSEGEMPVLERQTLEGMRRDRKTFGSRQNVSTTTGEEVPEMEKPEVILELDKSHPDPFWDTAFDMFVEQLEKRPPKRSVRKKKVGRTASGGGEDGEKEGEEKDKSAEVEEPEVKVKTEPEERDKVEEVAEGHVKLSASRLKVYRDEMRLMEERGEREGGREDEGEGEGESDEGGGGEVEKVEKVGEGKVKTRGRRKASEKVSVLDYESELERETRSESESTCEDDDDSLSLSGLESESSDSESSSSSNSSYRSEEESEEETVARKKQRMQTRLQTRSSRQRQVRGTGMKLRSKATPIPKATAKPVRKRKKRRKEEFYSSGKKKKPSFGDGSDFRPGWEEECYKFKQQLRMPEKLISISRPPKRSSASLPDLDPYRNSPSLDSSDVSMAKKSDDHSDDSDADSTKPKQRQRSDSNVTSLLKSRNGKKGSFINMLVDKYGKGNLRKQKDRTNEKKNPRILAKGATKAEVGPGGKENVLKERRRGREAGKKKGEEGESVYLGYFRRKSVKNLKESGAVVKSRTRRRSRDVKRAALVFGEERPASAPPMMVEEETSSSGEKGERKRGRVVKKVCGGVVTRGRGKVRRSGRPGLRSTAVLRSAKAVQISKRHLNGGRKRNMELLRMRAMASKKLSYLVGNGDGGTQLPMTKKRLKLKSVRRKFRSGFDYIRKKKKLKKDGDSADGSVKEKRVARPTSESVEDVQNEIKNWVINKGLGETILHRAARLGYTDVAAYCLEKMDCSPSPRDNAGYTPLHEACSRGHLDIAKLLLMYGASVSESAKGGIRPLHEAAENGFTELIRLLLSYGADPLLETYTGHTALSLVTDEEARRLIQHHLADVQGNVAPVWTFQGPASLYDPTESGYDPLCDPPSPPSVHSDYELEISDAMLPPLYRLSGDRDPDRRWVLMRDVLLYTKAKSKEVLLKQLGSPSVREMKVSEFSEQSRSCSLLGEKGPTKASKVVLLAYDERLRELLGVEKAVV